MLVFCSTNSSTNNAVIQSACLVILEIEMNLFFFIEFSPEKIHLIPFDEGEIHEL